MYDDPISTQPESRHFAADRAKAFTNKNRFLSYWGINGGLIFIACICTFFSIFNAYGVPAGSSIGLMWRVGSLAKKSKMEYICNPGNLNYMGAHAEHYMPYYEKYLRHYICSSWTAYHIEQKDTNAIVQVKP